MAQLELQFDRQDGTYVAGGLLRANVIVDVEQSATINSLTIEVHGLAENSWINKHSEKIYESSETYLNETLRLSESGTQISPGQHVFPVQFTLSDKLPSSFEGEFGNIRYKARVSLVSSSSAVPKTIERVFWVFARADLKQFVSARRPVEATDTTEFTCCCIPWGTVRAVLQIDRNGFVPSEAIKLSGNVHNGSRKKIENSQMQLVQQARFKARSRYENAEDVKHMEYVITAVNIGHVAAGKTLQLEDKALTVPRVIPTYEADTISINYVLRFIADPEIEIEIPVIIASLSEPDNK